MNEIKIMGKIIYIIILILIPIVTYFANKPIREYNEKHSNYSIEMEQQYCPYCGNELLDK